MKNLIFLFSVLCVLLPGIVIAGTIKGKVTDEHGARLPYATIYLQGTTIGTSANGNGDFSLQVNPGLYKVVCQYVGYTQNSFNISVNGDEMIEHTFVLKEQSLQMNEVVVKVSNEDPAYRIIRNAIKKRKFHLEQVKSFQTSIYLKGVMRSRKMPKKFMGKDVNDETDVVDSTGKGVLYLTEEDADYYTDGSNEKTVIHSVHESGDQNGLGFSKFPPIITFYENNVNVLGKGSRGFISPVSENALLYYRYKLLGEFSENGRTIYKIQVKQKRNYEPCFNGTIYIADEDWAIHSLNMTLVKQSGMDVMDTLTIDQLFLPLEKDNWVIKSELIYFTINLLGFDITADGVMVYNNQKVNQPIPDSILDSRITSAYDKGANKKDSSYWTQSRPVPLEQDEKNNFVVKDSLVKKLSTPEHLDSMRRKENKFKPLGLLTGGFHFSGKKYHNTYSTNSLVWGLGSNCIINYNTVEGFNAAPKLTWRHFVDSGKYLHGNTAVRYGFSNTHFNAIARLYYTSQDRAFPSRSWIYGIEGGKYVFQYNPANPVSEWLNTYYALLYRENDLKIYERWEGTAYLSRNYGTGIAWALKASYQQRLPLENTTNYSFIKGDYGGYKSNAPLNLLTTATAWETHNAALVSATISYKPGYTYSQLPDYKVANGSNWPRFILSYQKGIPGIFNSKTDFDKWRFSVSNELHLRLLGNFAYNLATGGFLNTNYVSIPDLMHLYSNRGVGFASPYLQSFQFAQYYEFSNKQQLYGEAHVEYHLRGLLSNKIPLLRQARWYLLCGGNVFYASSTLYYTEAFAGIENIGYKAVRLARIDFVQSWDSHMGRNSGIRFSINLNNSTGLRSYPMQGEW